MIMQETFAFCASHTLPTFPEGHKCRRCHGHLWRVTIGVRVDVGERGYAFDHADLDLVALETVKPLDHAHLNDIPGLERGLAEDVLAWLVPRVAASVAARRGELVALDLHEGSSGATLREVWHTKSWQGPLTRQCIACRNPCESVVCYRCAEVLAPLDDLATPRDHA